MTGVLRHLFAVVVLPFTMAIVIPIWLARRSDIRLATGRGVLELGSQVIGLILLFVGLLLFVASLRRFVTQGRGTLALWDPPRRLVVHGPYRYVRNPMISGVVMVLFGESLLLRSPGHLLWAVTFFGINAVYIPLLEEPLLERRFGAAYREYCRHVPRLLPRLRPWASPDSP